MTETTAKGAGRSLRPHGLGALRRPSFALYWSSRVLVAFAIEMLDTTVGWQVYRLTGEPFDLGLIGLAQFMPFILLFLFTGLVADRFSRRRILAACVAVQAVGAVAFLSLSFTGEIRFEVILALLAIFGVARAFHSPIHQSITPLLVPSELFSSAIAWSSTGNQVSRIAGPMLAGVMIAVGEATGANEVFVYAVVTGFLIVALVLSLFVRTARQTINRAPVSLEILGAGLRFIWTRQIILAAIALDLFAVLFGGATALLPIYAKDILHVGSEGFGVLRAAVMVGAFLGAIVLTQRPMLRSAGNKLLVSAAIFGASVIVFGLSTSFWLSFAALFVMGVADVISVFVRHNLVQIIPPDEMRGRVGAVVGVFVGASNQVGEFRSGVMASWLGAVPAVVIGGIVTVAVVVGFAWLFPSLRRVDTLHPETLIRDYQVPHDRHGRSPAHKVHAGE